MRMRNVHYRRSLILLIRFVFIWIKTQFDALVVSKITLLAMDYDLGCMTYVKVKYL